MKNALAIVLLPLFLTACAPLTGPASSGQEGAPSATRSENAARLAAAEREMLPSVPLTDDILYKLLSAEIGVQRGQWQSAYVTMLSLAQQTRDPRLAQRAMEIALSTKRHDEALAAVRVWRNLAPNSEQATQYFLGFVMLGNNLAEAQPIFEQRLRETPAIGRSALMFQIQRLLSRAKDKEAGFALLERLLTPYADTAEAHLALAQGAMSINNNARARKEALAAQAIRPGSELAVLTLAQVTSDKAEAEKVLVNFLDAYPKAREARLAYARLLVERKKYESSRREFEVLLKDNPSDLTALYALGVLSAQTNDNKSAEKYLSEYVSQLGTHPEEERDPTQALLLLSQIADERKDSEAALKWLNMIEPGEAYVGARIKRATILAKRGDLIGARKLLMETRADGEKEQAQLIIAEAQILRDANRTQEAFGVVETGLKRYPDNTDLLYEYGMLAEKANKLELMEKSLRRVMVLDPKNQHAYNALGYSLADRNLRLTEAFALIVKASEMAPDDPFIMDSLGWVHFRMGKLKEAEEVLRKAYSLRADAEIATHLGEVLWVNGKKEEAQKLWRDAKSKDPQNDTLKSTLLRLQVSL
ncbi:MAG: tetratricopeptide repeat protein [Burkholderiales bacterium]|nr:tetratricopeptide repeat protein [Burkholderiales bacterium]